MSVRPALAGLIVLGALAAAPALAQEPPSVAFNVGAATEYVFRGVSQTDEDPAIQGGVDVGMGMFYAGAWASNVDFFDSTDFEFDFYAGVKPTVGAVTLDLGVIYYGYADQPSGADYDYWEGKVAASVPAGPATLGVAVYYSPEFFGNTGDAWSLESGPVAIEECPYGHSQEQNPRNVKGSVVG